VRASNKPCRSALTSTSQSCCLQTPNTTYSSVPRPRNPSSCSSPTMMPGPMQRNNSVRPNCAIRKCPRSKFVARRHQSSGPSSPDLKQILLYLVLSSAISFATVFLHAICEVLSMESDFRISNQLDILPV